VNKSQIFNVKLSFTFKYSHFCFVTGQHKLYFDGFDASDANVDLLFAYYSTMHLNGLFSYLIVISYFSLFFFATID